MLDLCTSTPDFCKRDLPIANFSVMEQRTRGNVLGCALFGLLIKDNSASLLANPRQPVPSLLAKTFCGSKNAQHCPLSISIYSLHAFSCKCESRSAAEDPELCGRVHIAQDAADPWSTTRPYVYVIAVSYGRLCSKDPGFAEPELQACRRASGLWRGSSRARAEARKPQEGPRVVCRYPALRQQVRINRELIAKS